MSVMKKKISQRTNLRNDPGYLNILDNHLRIYHKILHFSDFIRNEIRNLVFFIR